MHLWLSIITYISYDYARFSKILCNTNTLFYFWNLIDMRETEILNLIFLIFKKFCYLYIHLYVISTYEVLVDFIHIIFLLLSF